MAKPAIPPQPPRRFESLPAQSLPSQSSATPGLPLEPPLASQAMPQPVALEPSAVPAASQIVRQVNPAEVVAGSVAPLNSQVSPQLAQPLPSAQQIAHHQLEQRTLQEVLLLLETMFNREDATVRMILDRLYDVGSVNLVNQRVSNRYLNQIARWIARCSRPVAKLLIMRWFKRNCPRLISNWLYNQVKFAPRQIAGAKPATTGHLAEAAAHSGAGSPAHSTEVEVYRRQIELLNSRVRMLTILLIGVTFTLGGSLAWAVWQQSAWRIRFQPASATRPAALLDSTTSNLQPPNLDAPFP